MILIAFVLNDPVVVMISLITGIFKDKYYRGSFRGCRELCLSTVIKPTL